MNWKNTEERSDERAVSPVIGVIMMVAVTVILAAVVSMLVLGMGQDVDNSPQANFAFEYDDTASEVIITHEGGDTLDADNVEVRVAGGDGTGWGTGDITAGDNESFGASAGDSVRVVYVSDSGDTHTLATYEVPT